MSHRGRALCRIKFARRLHFLLSRRSCVEAIPQCLLFASFEGSGSSPLPQYGRRTSLRNPSILFTILCIWALPQSRIPRALRVVWIDCYHFPFTLLCVTGALPMRYRCVTDALPMRYRALPMRYRCVTDALPMRYRCVTDALPRVTWYVSFRLFLDKIYINLTLPNIFLS